MHSSLYAKYRAVWQCLQLRYTVDRRSACERANPDVRTPDSAQVPALDTSTDVDAGTYGRRCGDLIRSKTVIKESLTKGLWSRVLPVRRPTTPHPPPLRTDATVGPAGVFIPE